MEKIKFRGMDANGVMRYGKLSQDKENSTSYYKEYSQRICWNDSNIPVSNKSLGQFIGLSDKNGKEIYTGDIVEWMHYTEGKKHTEIKDLHTLCDGFFDGQQGEFEVIGNIHENPKISI